MATVTSGLAIGRRSTSSMFANAKHVRRGFLQKNPGFARWYTLALTRTLPDSFGDALTAHSTHVEPFCIKRAKQEHAKYTQELQKVIEVVNLPALETHPDSCFVEDTLVALEDRLILTRPGHSSRRGEVDSIKDFLLEHGMHDKIDDMRAISDTATCDGGDVLYTGNHLFVGLSNRTNEEGANVLVQIAKKANVECIVVPPVFQGNEVLHLKSAVTHINSDTLVIPTGTLGDELVNALQAKNLGYSTIRVPDVLSCNVVVCNDTLLAQDLPGSREILQKAAMERGLLVSWISTSELSKKDAALTCCSVLLQT